MDKKYVASVSLGKDSLAMVLYILENRLPLDEVLFYDTGMEFSAIYRNCDRLAGVLEQHGVAFTPLKPPDLFLYDMIERPVESEENGAHNGYGWCGGVCRWGTSKKIQTLDTYARGAVRHYVGIAADEVSRLDKLVAPKCAPLKQAGMTEVDCLRFCRDRGWSWMEETPRTGSGYIDLYDILDRVSCWCCANKNLSELRNIYYYLPQYWARLLDLQSKLERPMKKYKNKKYGEYGNVWKLNEIFAQEIGG